MKEGGEEDEGQRAGGGLPTLQTAWCIAWGKWSEVLAPQLAPPPPPQPAPISASFSLSSSHTRLCFPREPDSTAGLIKPREAERQKKDGEGKRGHTTGRHQLKPCSLSFFFCFFFRQFFPFISRFMIEFLTNTLAVHWVQTHSKKLLFDSTSLRTL